MLLGMTLWPPLEQTLEPRGDGERGLLTIFLGSQSVDPDLDPTCPRDQDDLVFCSNLKDLDPE